MPIAYEESWRVQVLGVLDHQNESIEAVKHNSPIMNTYEEQTSMQIFVMGVSALELRSRRPT